MAVDRREFVHRMLATACAMPWLRSSAKADDCGGLHVEVIVSTLEDALAAERGGATELEVAVHLEQGGLTPPLELVREIGRRTKLPQHVMLREHDGFALSGAQELETLKKKARQFAALNVAGLVVGWVKDGELDFDALRQVMAAAPHTKFTVHNAIEQTRDPLKAIRALKQFPKVGRVLVNGVETDLPKRIARLRTYETALSEPHPSQKEGDRVGHPTGERVGHPCLVVNKLRLDAAVAIEAATKLRQFHFGDAVRTPERPAPEGAVDGEKVKRAVRELAAGR